MSANKYSDHLFILPEDEATEEIANGFVLHNSVQNANVRVLTPVRGWRHVVEAFENDYLQTLRTYPRRRIVLLIDFDEDSQRRNHIEGRIPDDVRDRVFLIGVWDEPKDLKEALSGLSEEAIGRLLADDCFRNTNVTWSHPHLEHNTDELARLRDQVRPFLFDDPK